MTRIATIILAVIALSLIDFGYPTSVPTQEWSAYKSAFGKNYDTAIAESNARFYYAYNKILIDNHNALYARNRKTFKLKINQFTDMRLIHFNALFPVATFAEPSNAVTAPSASADPPSYDPINDFGFATTIENQGTKCNSGWAYAAVKTIEILNAQQLSNMNPASLSAQNIIDCAGRSIGCKSQVPQAAFDYLTQYDMDLLLETEYKNNITLSTPGMCVPKGLTATKLGKYSTIANGDNKSLKSYVGAGFPIVVEFNPTSFEFMHYAEGIFQPATSRTGSHFMALIGYGTNVTSGNDYWILQNSFDTTWGEMGLMRIARSNTVNLAKSAIFPSELA